MTNKAISVRKGSKPAKKQVQPARKQAAAKAPASKKHAQAQKIAKKLAEKFPAQPEVNPARETKKQQAIAMLREGATLIELMERFGWLRHTTRGCPLVLL